MAIGLSIQLLFIQKNNKIIASQLTQCEQKTIEGTNHYTKIISDLNRSSNLNQIDSMDFITQNFDIVNLSNFVQNNKALVLLYPKISCQSCIQDEISAFKRISNQEVIKNTILIICSENPKSFATFLRINEIELSVLFYNDPMKFSFLKSNGPFFFIFQSEGEITNMHIPIANYGDETYDYFEIVNNLFKQ